MDKYVGMPWYACPACQIGHLPNPLPRAFIADGGSVDYLHRLLRRGVHASGPDTVILHSHLPMHALVLGLCVLLAREGAGIQYMDFLTPFSGTRHKQVGPIPANGGVGPVPMPRTAFKRHPETVLVKRYRVKRYQLMFC